MILNYFLPFVVLAGFHNFELAAGNNGESSFDIEMLKYLAQTSPSQNFVVSTRNLKVNLGLVSLGTGGNTAKELREALNLPHVDELAKQELKKISNTYQQMEGVEVKMANQILTAPDITIKGSFEELIRNDFPTTKITTADFSSPEPVANEINKWVSDATNGMISELFDPSDISDDTIMVLLSAVFFKGVWKEEFNRELTEPGCFYRRTSECEMVPMMKGYGLHSYMPNLDADIVKLPYKDDVHYMVLVVPKTPEGLGRLITLFSFTAYAEILRDLDKRVEQSPLTMPKFSMEYKLDNVKDFFITAHVTEVFNGGDFSPMLDSPRGRPVGVSKIKHKAKIEVDEQGATAAAATGTSAVFISAPPPAMIVDRPFLFFILNKESGILFEGVVHNPGGVTN